MSDGFVYILTNEAMPGYIKIGITRQNDVAIRVKQLDNTSLPFPFECYYAARVRNCAKVERTLHFVFGNQRARANREFFTSDRDAAKAIIELVAIEDVSLSDAEQAISPVQRLAIEEAKSAERRSLSGLGLAPGTVLTFSKDPSTTCIVSGDRMVQFEGAEMSLSGAAMKVIRRMGYSWPSVAGFHYWMYDGVKLSELPRQGPL